MHLAALFGPDRVFVETSNCDCLHLRAGLAPLSLREIHGSLSRLQCSVPCCQTLRQVDEAFLCRLEAEPDWVPMCEACGTACLRPNVMIFGDTRLVDSVITSQAGRAKDFVDMWQSGAGKANFVQSKANLVVLELGAGVVVPSIRCSAESLGARAAGGLIRINPSRDECAQLQTAERLSAGNGYAPLVARSEEALAALCEKLQLKDHEGQGAKNSLPPGSSRMTFTTGQPTDDQGLVLLEKLQLKDHQGQGAPGGKGGVEGKRSQRRGGAHGVDSGFRRVASAGLSPLSLSLSLTSAGLSPLSRV